MVAINRLDWYWYWQKADWDRRMLEVPNIIDCGDYEVKVIGERGEEPLEGHRNLMPEAYYAITREPHDESPDLLEVIKNSIRDTFSK